MKSSLHVFFKKYKITTQGNFFKKQAINNYENIDVKSEFKLKIRYKKKKNQMEKYFWMQIFLIPES